jgi:flagellar protein FlgJ
MAISSIDSIYARLASGSAGSSITGLNSGESISNLSKSSELEDQIKNASSDDELLSACKSFEAYFLEQMFKSMASTVDTEDEGEYTSMFKDTLYESYAKDAVENQGYGIAKMLYDSMKRNQTSETTDTTTNADSSASADPASSVSTT